jgi:hypothetical protein
MARGSRKEVDSARLSYRLVDSKAAGLLAEMNSSLIQAEGSDNPLTLEEGYQAAEIQLDVLEGNRGALEFWEGHGFEPRAQRMRLGTAGRSSTRKSCRAIIYRRSLMGIRYLLLRHENGGHWSVPKGRRKEAVYSLARVRRPRVREQVDEIPEHRCPSYAEARSLLTSRGPAY